MERPALLPNIKPLAAAALPEAREHRIAPSRELRLHLPLGELLSNIRLHAYPPGAPGATRVSVLPAEGAHDGTLRLIIGASGIPFNPLEHPLAPDLSAAIEDRDRPYASLV